MRILPYRTAENPFIPKSGQQLPSLLTLKLLTDDHGQADAVCLLVKNPPI